MTKNKYLIYLVIILFISCSQRKVIMIPKKKSDTSIRIVTYNVNWGVPNPLSVINILNKLNADIICLQETNQVWEQYLRKYLNDKYDYIRFKHFGGGGGLAILSKYTFKDKNYIQPVDGWFPSWLVNIKSPFGNIQLLNVHLKPGLKENGSIGFMGSAYFDAQEIHIKELKKCLTYIQKDNPFVICGDFNEGDNGKAVLWLKKMNIQDSLQQFDTNSKTWKWKVLLFSVSGRYDHILYNKYLQCLNSFVVQAGPSDHFPVVSEFEIINQNKNNNNIINFIKNLF